MSATRSPITTSISAAAASAHARSRTERDVAAVHLEVHLEAAPAGLPLDVVEQERRRVVPGDPCGGGRVQRPASTLSCNAGELPRARRPGSPRARRPRCRARRAHGRCAASRRAIRPVVDVVSRNRRCRSPGSPLCGSPRRQVEGLEAFERGAMSRIDLTPALTSDERGAGERAEVGGLVERLLRTSVHAAEAACGNTRTPARCASQAVAATVVPPLSPFARGDRQVAHARLHHAVGGAEPSISSADSPTVGTPVDHADRRGHDAELAHELLGLEADLEVARAGEPVGEDRGLEREHRRAGVDRPAHLLGDADRGRGVWLHPAIVGASDARGDRSDVGAADYRGALCRNRLSSPKIS